MGVWGRPPRRWPQPDADCRHGGGHAVLAQHLRRARRATQPPFERRIDAIGRPGRLPCPRGPPRRTSGPRERCRLPTDRAAGRPAPDRGCGVGGGGTGPLRRLAGRRGDRGRREVRAGGARRRPGDGHTDSGERGLHRPRRREPPTGVARRLHPERGHDTTHPSGAVRRDVRDERRETRHATRTRR